MTAFRFEAARLDGKIESGVIDADNPRLVRSTLRERGLTAIKVEALGADSEGKGAQAAGSAPRRGKRLGTHERASVMRQLASLVVAGLPLAQALAAVQQQAERPGIRDLMAAVRSEVVGGHSLAVAMSRHPRDFPELDRALVAAGEQSGNLGHILMRLADHIEARDTLTSKVRLAFAYPAIVTFVALCVVTALLTYVVPQVVGVFAQTRQKLPFLTVALIWLSDFLRRDGWILVLALIAFVFIFRAMIARPAGKRSWHALILRIPLAGALMRRADLARFSETLAILAGAGVPILRALQAARDTMSNVILRHVVDAAVIRVREGAPLSRALAGARDQPNAADAFPPVMLNLISSGEATGKLPEMLERAATGQTAEFERRTLMMTSILEPVLVLVMGAVVLLIVLAILMPIIEINQLIR